MTNDLHCLIRHILRLVRHLALYDDPKTSEMSEDCIQAVKKLAKLDYALDQKCENAFETNRRLYNQTGCSQGIVYFWDEPTRVVRKAAEINSRLEQAGLNLRVVWVDGDGKKYKPVLGVRKPVRLIRVDSWNGVFGQRFGPRVPLNCEIPAGLPHIVEGLRAGNRCD